MLLADHLRRADLALGRLVGVLLSFVLGIVFGGISGYYGGWIDTDHPAGDRVPALDPDASRSGWRSAAAVPPKWPVEYTYFAITLILLADRLDRPGASRARALPVAARGGLRAGGAALRRERDRGSSSATCCRRSAQHIIAALTLAVPGMILGETALCFLGLGPARAGRSAGACCSRTRRTSRPWRSRPGCCSPAVAVIITDHGVQLHGRRPARRGRPVQGRDA